MPLGTEVAGGIGLERTLSAEMSLFASGWTAVTGFSASQHFTVAESPIAAWPSCAVLEHEWFPPYLLPRVARLLFAGDVMQHLPQVYAARRPDGSFDYTPVFESVTPYFAAADLVAVNLETTLTASGNYTGYPCFRSPLPLAGALRKAGVDVCALANNHCCDGGAIGIRTTVAELDRVGIRHTGVFADSVSRRSDHPLFLEVNGIRFALLNYTYSTNGIPAPDGMTVNGIDTVAMRCDLASARAGADCTVVMIHWGDEYVPQPSDSQRRLATFLRRNGADLIVGSHPHIVQPWEADAAGAVFYSLGNFVSNQRRRYCDGGLMARVEVVCRCDGSLRFAFDVVPVWVLPPEYRILPPEAADTVPMPPSFRGLYQRFMEDTRFVLRGEGYR